MYNGILFKNEILNEKLKNYSNILEYNKNFNKFKHDINKHLSCIKNLYSSNIQNHSSADSYIDSLCNSLNKLDIDFDTGNNVLDVILTDKKRTCDKKNITFNPFLMYNIYNFLDDLDICSIFANILDNAIEACDKIDSTDSSSPKKTIFLETKLRFNCLIIRCSNSRINKVRYKTKNILFTDKYNSEHHGYGLESISYSVNKYNGYFEIDTSNDKKYEISVLIPMPYDFVYDTEKIYSN
jgi:sensor histidine kinase regulating citrate/malate metabolism